MSDQIETSFQDLKSKGLVSQDRHLKRRYAMLHPLLNFRAGSLFSPRAICYSSSYSSLSEDEVRFALMHEEGHFATKQYSRLLLILGESALRLGLLAVLVGLVSVLLIFLGIRLDQGIISAGIKFITVVVVALAALTIALKLVKHAELPLDEDNADDFAAVRMKEAFGVRRPSKVLGDLLDHLRRHRSILGRIVNPILRVFGGDIHRPDHERVERIAQKYDESSPPS